MEMYLYSFLSVALVSLVSFVGVLSLSLNVELLKRYVFVLVSLAVGALLGDAFLHLLPEAFLGIQNTSAVSLLVILGILVFFVLEKVLHWHHHASDCEGSHSVAGRLILVSDGIHNFIDGLLIGVSFIVSRDLGFATTLAVILHEIPQEIGDFGVLLHAGYSKAQALWWNFVSALFAVLGVIVVFIGEGASALSLWLLPIAAGGFIYIALSDLVPELHKAKSTKHIALQLGSIGVGVLAMFLLLVLEV